MANDKPAKSIIAQSPRKKVGNREFVSVPALIPPRRRGGQDGNR